MEYIAMPQKETSKKADVLQIRFDKCVADQLSALANEEDRPVSSMVRSWITDRLREELRKASSVRSSWRQERLVEVRRMICEEFPHGPTLVVHGQPLTPNLRIEDLEAVKRSNPSLFPLSGIYTVSSRVNRHGLQSLMLHHDKVVNWSQIFRTSQVETVKHLIHEGRQIIGLPVNESIVLIIREQFLFLESQKFPLPYVFNISLLGVKDFWLVTQAKVPALPHVGFQDEELTLSEVMLSDADSVGTDQEAAKFVRPQLEEIWNASGHARLPDFTADGSWQGPWL